MWISNMIANNGKRENTAETGTVTIGENDGMETMSSDVSRFVSAFSPYGYECSIPTGENVLLIKSGNDTAAVGTENKSTVPDGEIKIISKGGAYIQLKNDGSVIINSLVINRNGEIENDS